MATPEEMRERYRKVAYRYRNKPGQYGLRPHTVEICLTTYAGSHTGDGAKTETFTPIVERDGLPPKVRWLTTKELAVGGLQAGTVQIGPITPDFSGGGTNANSIRGVTLGTGGMLRFRITGATHPSGALYEALNTDFGAALHYTFQASPVSDS